MTEEYEFKREPFAHQRRAFYETRDLEFFGLLWEQRTGKSQTVIDTAAWNYERGRIDALLVLAPNGVHANWVLESIPECLPDRVPRYCLIWRSNRADTRTYEDEFRAMLGKKCLVVLAVNYDALTTKAAKRLINEFLKRRRVLAVADESDAVLCSPAAKRTIACVGTWKGGGIARRVAMRRIVTGTPVAESPFDAYSQFNFLKFGCLGTDSYVTFKNRYAKFSTGVRHVNLPGGRHYEQEYPIIVGYANLEDLAERVGKHSSRVLRADCADLPKDMRVTRRFDLSDEQRKVYDDLSDQFEAELRAEKRVTAAMVLVRWLRLQQVASGFVVPDAEPKECPDCVALDGCPDENCATCYGIGIVPDEREAVILPNPRQDVYAREIKGTVGQTVTFCRFKHDIDEIGAVMTSRKEPFAVLSGDVSPDDRDMALSLFRSGAVRHIVATESTGGRGLNLSAADTVIFYSHGWSLRQRLQAEDRIRHLGKTRPLSIVDVVAFRTIDEDISEAHREKRNVSDRITGDWRFG